MDAVVVGIVVGGVLGAIAVTRDRTPYPWVVLAWALPVVALVISGNLAGAE
jgi:hypothetical protein